MLRDISPLAFHTTSIGASVLSSMSDCLHFYYTLRGLHVKIERSITAPEVGVDDNGPDFHHEWSMRIRTRMMVYDVADDHSYDSQQIMRIRLSQINCERSEQHPSRVNSRTNKYKVFLQLHSVSHTVLTVLLLYCFLRRDTGVGVCY